MSKRDARRSAAIHSYTGPNGGGKSLAMVHDTIPSLKLGRPILSTVRLMDPESWGKVSAEASAEAWAVHGIEWATETYHLPHPLYRRLRQWSDLLDFEAGDVLLDEVQGVVSSRQHQSLPPAIVNLLLQLRRRDVLLRWTSPAYSRADVVLRQVTTAVTWCRGFNGKRPEGRLWASNGWFLWRTYDAFAFDEFTSGKRESLKSIARQFYRRSRDDTDRFYDTLAPVDHIVDVTEAGTCLRCGGSRRRPSCSCEGGEHGREAPARTRRPNTSAAA